MNSCVLIAESCRKENEFWRKKNMFSLGGTHFLRHASCRMFFCTCSFRNRRCRFCSSLLVRHGTEPVVDLSAPVAQLRSFPNVKIIRTVYETNDVKQKENVQDPHIRLSVNRFKNLEEWITGGDVFYDADRRQRTSEGATVSKTEESKKKCWQSKTSSWSCQWLVETHLW